MKKILQRTFLVLGIFAVVIIAAVVSLTTGGEKPDSAPVATDAAGTTYYLYEDKEKNTTYAVVTDEIGNRYAAEFDGNTVGSTVENINDKVAIDDVPTNFIGQHTEITHDVNAYTGVVNSDPATTTTTAPSTSSQGEVPSTTAPAQVTDAPTTTQPSTQAGLTAYRINKYQQLLAGGTYLMEFTDPELSSLPVTMAIKNGNMYIDTTMEIDEGSEPMNVKMLYLKKSETFYMLIDKFKKYIKLPEDIMGEDMDMTAMLAEFNVSDVGDVSVKEVEINGQVLILESYTDDDGVVYNYYFNGEDLVRRDSVSKDGTIESMYISRFTTDVPDSTFDIPSDYGYLNLSWMGALV